VTPIAPSLGCPCDGRHLRKAFTYERPPAGEMRFPFGGEYRRAYRRCDLCGHYFSQHALDMAALYAGTYVDATYADSAGLRRSFERIIALPEGKSDNRGRVRRILDFAARHLPKLDRAPRVLDVGSGLAVFPYAMSQAGWQVTALDPDGRAAAHARDTVGVAAIAGDFMALDASTLGGYDAVTFNKVLEHVEAPVSMLARAAALIDGGGFVYLEVPDGEAAAREGGEREEFFVDHHHVFSMASTALLAERAGFRTLAIERLREPSGKYTVRAFLGVRET
jgi:2-polyprenyl-3-methyl-5-hydroxy-6-metoxy-1,4-benzoquinol methylase